MPRMGDDNKDRDDNDDGNKGCQGRPLGESTEDGDLQQCTMCYLSGSIYFQHMPEKMCYLQTILSMTMNE